MQFKLRTVFVWIILLAILLGTYAFIENTWFGPARLGSEAQAEFNRLIADNQWNGFIAPTFYLHNVRIGLYNVDETEIRKLYPILHRLYWLKHIVIHSPSLSPQMLQELQAEFPECMIDVDSNVPETVLN
jgi:hypothetical protein